MEFDLQPPPSRSTPIPTRRNDEPQFDDSSERDTQPWRSDVSAGRLSSRGSVESLDSLVDPYEEDGAYVSSDRLRAFGPPSSTFPFPSTLLTPPPTPSSPSPSVPLSPVYRRFVREEDSLSDAADAGYHRRRIDVAKGRALQTGRERGVDTASRSATSLSHRGRRGDEGGGDSTGHLPSLEQSRFDGITSSPNTHVMRDVEFAVMTLVSEKVFAEFMDDPLGRSRFREWLKGTRDGTTIFDAWLDTNSFKRQTEALHAGALAVSDVYLSHEFPNSQLPIPTAMKHRLHDALQLVAQVDSLLEGPSAHLLQSLYAGQFQTYIRQKLVETASVRLGKFNLSESDREGLGDCFCLTNPRLPDHPIVLASAGFEAVTGYSAKSIVSRNCRFLQGPATSPASVQRIRDALERGETTTTLLLNYRKDGTAFYNLLAIIPLRDTNGELQYFIGGQVNVTGLLASSGGLSFLVGSADDGTAPGLAPSTIEVSPSMQAYKDAFRSGIDPSRAAVSAAGQVRRAAGALGDISPRTDNRLFVAPEKEGGKVSRFFGIKPRRSTVGKGAAGADSQAILGAEGELGQIGGSIERQMTVFSNTYTKVVVFRKENRRIIFVTEPFLRYVGLPHATPIEKHSSKVLHKDILDILVGTTKNETSRLKKALKITINSGDPASIPCGVRSRTKSAISGRFINIAKQGVLHVTPLKDQQGVVEAFVGIFS